MREDISADLLSRINKLNQTIFENANPLMRAIIIKANQTLNVNTIRTETTNPIGSVDITAKTDEAGAITEYWIAGIVSGAIIVTVYAVAEEIDWVTPTSTFNVAPEEAGAKARDIAIEFDGEWVENVFISAGSPWISWGERQSSADKTYILRWDGEGAQPAATELKSATR